MMSASRPVRVSQLLVPSLAFLLIGCEAAESEREDAREGETSVRIVEGERSPDEHPEARLRIETPSEGATAEGTDVSARLRLEGFQLRAATPGVEARGIAVSEDGQHIHVIVDDRPYEAIYDISDPVELNGLEPGAHLLRAFPSRSWHESVKAPGAFAITWFSVGEAEAERPVDPEAPLLTYSRPKGEYEGADADSIMVDFYLTNVELSEGGHVVRLTVNDTVSHDMSRWAPHYILGLPAGEHRLRLELLDPTGERVPGIFNVTERTITVIREGNGEGQERE